MLVIINNYCEEFESILSLSLSLSNMSMLSAKAKIFEPGRETHPPEENYYSAVLAKVQKERDGLKKDKKIMKETINMFESEVDRFKNEVKVLRDNIKEAKSGYFGATLEIADLKKALDEAESANNDLIDMNQVIRDECDYYREKNFSLNQEVSDLEHKLISSTQSDNVEERFEEATLKMEFIFKKMIQVGAIQPDHSEWVLPMFEEIYIPEVSQELKERILPSDEYDPQDDDGDELDQERRIQEWNDEEKTEDKMPYGLRLLFAQDIAKANRYVKLMQSAVRKYLKNYSLRGEKARAAVMIQKIWRRYNSKSIKMLDSLGGPLGTLFWIAINHKLYPRSVRVRFVNTGDITACVHKITLDGGWKCGRLHHVPALAHQRVSFSLDDPESFEYFTEHGKEFSQLKKGGLSCLMEAFQGDWFQVKFEIYTDSGKTEKIKYLHIPPRILTDVVEESSNYYSSHPIEYTIDINTGICLKDIDDIRELLTCQSASEMNSSKMINVFRKRWGLPPLESRCLFWRPRS